MFNALKIIIVLVSPTIQTSRLLYHSLFLMNFQQFIYKQILESVSMLDRPFCTYHIPYKLSGYETFQVVIHFLVLHDVENLCKTWYIKANQAPKTVNWESTSRSKFQINVTNNVTMQSTCNAWFPLTLYTRMV